MLNISFEKDTIEGTAVIAVLVNQELSMDQDAILLDQKHHGLISKTLQNSTQFKGKLEDSKILTTTSKDGRIANIILIGIGESTELKACDVEKIGGAIATQVRLLRAASAAVKINHKIGHFTPEEFASLLAGGALLGSYSFDKYFTQKKPEERQKFENLDIIVPNKIKADELFRARKSLAMGIFFARDCISEPGNILYPESYASRVIDTLEPIGVEVEVLGEREMRNLGMGALLGVGQGSINESKLVVMRYNGGDDKQKPVCLVGKGVTFDTGGISIKPANGMWDMKYDMGGSAAVVGTLKALALREAKVNVVGIIGLVENMPGGNAQRPGDIVKTANGQTVEVLNTDAEGRLVLSDCLWYAQDKFDPSCVIDLATLTGAIVVGLGNTYAGLFSNNDELVSKLMAASTTSNELLWRMPLHKNFDKMIDSKVADIANISIESGAGSSTAAHFLQRFIKDGIAWAHLDIAGVAWEKKGHNSTVPQGAVGFGVRLLNQFIYDNYEL